MNVIQVVSIIFALAVFLFAVLTSTEDPTAMLDVHGMLIVIGGTIGASSVSFQLDRVFMMLKVFWKRNIRGKKPNYINCIKELMKLADLYRNDSGELKGQVEGCSDPFMKEAMEALLDKVVEDDKLFKILVRRVNTMYERYKADANRFTSMGKYPPAMGLMGAVLGMIALLGGLGKPGAEAGIGPAMSIALIATFYGIAIANLMIIPIGESLGEAAKEAFTKNKIIVEGVRLISQRTNPIVLAEELNSFLLPGERIDWKNLD
jgi:chemotaxis protein MotA